MDIRIRRNDLCVIGLPRCDFVFSSTRECFIGYGFRESALETAILKKLLEERGIVAVEAGGATAPGQNAYCAKICSKIITSQFCVVLINNDVVDGREVPNANVNMEYGLMLGFNKYVLPFQRMSQKLPFNVAGLDTIKYSNDDFERKAAHAVDLAISATEQSSVSPAEPDQQLAVFLLTKKALVTPLDSDGEKNLFQLGSPLGFNLLNDFTGFEYIFFGNFTALRPEAAVWRIRTLHEIIDGRHSSLPQRLEFGVGTIQQIGVLRNVFEKLRVWALVTSPDDRESVRSALSLLSPRYRFEVFCLDDIRAAVLGLSAS
jgi:hypothetical protein